MPSITSALLITYFGILFLGCDTGSSSMEEAPDSTVDLPDPIAAGSWHRPAVGASWFWQLQGKLDLTISADIYDIDLFETPSSVIAELQGRGVQVICYFSAGSFEAWRADAGDFPGDVLGATLDGFEDERWLDVRSEAVRSIMTARLDLAAARNCDGVEPDNVDGYANNPGFPLTPEDQLVFNSWLGNEAHRRSLFVALKNDGDQIDRLQPYFDLALNEQCHEFEGDCDPLVQFIDAGKPVLNAEYLERFRTDSGAREALCSDAREARFSTLILPLDLDGSFRIEC